MGGGRDLAGGFGDLGCGHRCTASGPTNRKGSAEGSCRSPGRHHRGRKSVSGTSEHQRYQFQPVSGPFTTQFPVELAHGKNADFRVSFLATLNWLREFSTGFIQDLSDRSMKTLVAQIHTSVGETIEVRPEKDLIRRLRESAMGVTG